MLINSYECWRCGKLIEYKKEPLNRVFCPECYELNQQDKYQLLKEYGILKTKVMYENAIRIMEKSGMYMYEYHKAAETTLNQALGNTWAFESSHEMITAIVLNEFGYEFEPNYKIKSYRADFYVPELSVCVEIDGHLHDYKREYDSTRDIEIRAVLGSEWEVVRIPTKYIEQNPPKIPEAIEALANKKRELRKQNNGIIPETFSKRERAHYAKVGENYTQTIKVI